MTKADHRKLIDSIVMSLKSVLDIVAVAHDQLNNLRADLHNRPPLQPRKRSAPPTRLVRDKIKRLHRMGLSQQRIAHRLNISVGRVSETLRGKRR